jgi:hypothetical protein
LTNTISTAEHADLAHAVEDDLQARRQLADVNRVGLDRAAGHVVQLGAFGLDHAEAGDS